MPTLTGTLTAVTGGTIDTSRVRNAYVRAPQRRGSLGSEGGLVTSVPVPVPTSGELSLDLEPGPAILVVDTLDAGQDVFDLYVTADMTLLSEALAESAPPHERSWMESQLVQLRGETVDAAGTAISAAEQAALDRAEVEGLRESLVEAAEQNAAPHLTTSALNATYQPVGDYASAKGFDPAPLASASVTVRTSGIAPVDVLADGLVYGHRATGNTLHSSADSGATWTQVNANLPAAVAGTMVNALRNLPDGEVLMAFRSGGLYRSTGWATNKATATWTQVWAPTAGAWVLPWGVAVSGQRVLVTEYCVPREASRKLALSTDGGRTFTTVRDLNVLYPNDIAQVHWHAVEIDPWAGGRLWASFGDVSPHGMMYSDDDGASWTMFNDRQPTTITATDEGLVLGSDEEPNGLAFIDRATMEYREVITWRGGPSVIGFANRGIRDPRTGVVYVVFQSQGPNGYTVPMLASSPDGRNGGIVHELAPTGMTQTAVQNVMIDAHGVLLAPANNDGVNVDIKGTPLSAGILPYNRLNSGGALSGSADAQSVATGPRSNASVAGVAIGQDANARSADSSVAIGSGAVATQTRVVAIGKQATATGNSGVAIGANSSAGVGVVIGANTSATDGVAIGNNADTMAGVAIGVSAKALSSTGVAIGYGATTNTTLGNQTAIGGQATAGQDSATALGTSASASALGATALGKSAAATHTGSVAIGRDTASSGANQVSVGPRHLRMLNSAAPTAAMVTGGGGLFIDAGALKYIGGSGTVTTVAPA